jgi:hypothetical protein
VVPYHAQKKYKGLAKKREAHLKKKWRRKA